MSGESAGSPAFTPRQQVLDFKYAEPAVDVWAAVASLYFMLTGYISRDLKDKDLFLAGSGLMQNTHIWCFVGAIPVVAPPIASMRKS